MAKAPNTPAASPATAASGEFDLGLEVPAVKRSVGNGGNRERRDKLMRMPIGASFLETVNVPESIKDDAEREKAFNDLCRKLSNRSLSNNQHALAVDVAGHIDAVHGGSSKCQQHTMSRVNAGQGDDAAIIDVQAPCLSAPGRIDPFVAACTTYVD